MTTDSSPDFMIRDITRLTSSSSNIVALVSVRLGDALLTDCRLVLLPDGSVELAGPQVRRFDPIQKRTCYRTLAWLPVEMEKQIAKAAAAVLAGGYRGGVQ